MLKNEKKKKKSVDSLCNSRLKNIWHYKVSLSCSYFSPSTATDEVQCIEFTWQAGLTGWTAGGCWQNPAAAPWASSSWLQKGPIAGQSQAIRDSDWAFGRVGLRKGERKKKNLLCNSSWKKGVRSSPEDTKVSEEEGEGGGGAPVRQNKEEQTDGLAAYDPVWQISMQKWAKFLLWLYASHQYLIQLKTKDCCRFCYLWICGFLTNSTI